jgi:hypothetical protein
MSKVTMFAHSGRTLLIAMMFVAVFALTSGCGGSSTAASVPPPSGNAPPPAPPPPPPVVIEGVATPTSVAVVTATNAQ